jgi:hypothetical protein
VVPDADLEQGAQGLLVVVLGPPARVPERGAVDHPGIDDEAQVGRGRRRDADPVQALGGAERDPGRELDPAQPAELLDRVLVQPAVAADRELAGHVAVHRQLQGGNQVVDVAELPPRCAALHGQQPRRLEMPGHDGVDVVTDQGGRAEDGQFQSRVRPR